MSAFVETGAGTTKRSLLAAQVRAKLYTTEQAPKAGGALPGLGIGSNANTLPLEGSGLGDDFELDWNRAKAAALKPEGTQATAEASVIGIGGGGGSATFSWASTTTAKLALTIQRSGDVAPITGGMEGEATIMGPAHPHSQHRDAVNQDCKSEVS